MDLTKFCPIMSRRGFGLCMRERCAWWSEWGRCCCIPMLAETLCDQAAHHRLRTAWGKVVFAANGGRFYVVNVELVPYAFRHEVMMMRETFWPEDVERARIEG